MCAGSRDAEADAGRVEAVRKRLLQRDRGCGGRLAVVEIGGRGGAGARAAGLWRVPAAVRGRAVETLEGGVVARLGEQFQAHGGLALPLGPATKRRAITIIIIIIIKRLGSATVRLR